MAARDLTSLADTKAWLGISTTDDDMIITRLISQVSRVIMTSLNRPFLLPKTVTEYYDGNGASSLLLRSWPAVSVASVSVNGSAVAASAPGSNASGWILEVPDAEPPGNQQILQLQGSCFAPGMSNVAITYVAGYRVSAESAVIPPSPFQIVAQAPFGAWASDEGVTFASAGALSAVSGAPAAGQYSVTGGTYTFAAADAGKTVLFSYGYIPADLAECAMEWVAERYKFRDRIGVSSKSLGGQETVSFTNSAVPVFVREAIDSYMRVVPC